MKHKEAFLEEVARDHADEAIESAEFLSLVEMMTAGSDPDTIASGYLTMADLQSAHKAAIGRRSYNTVTHVAIPKAELERLKDREHFLDCLEAAGIDNAEAYGEGCRIYREDKGDE